SGDSTYTGNTGTQLVDVAKAHLTVTATTVSVVYGGSIPALSATLTGFVGGDTSSVVSGAPGLSTTAAANSGVGVYPIMVAVGTLSAANYDFPNLVNSTLTITKAHLTVTANPASSTYGTPIPALTAAITGFVNGETVGVVSGAASLATTAT